MYGIISTSDSSLIIVGSGDYSKSAVIIKVNKSGNVIWAKKINASFTSESFINTVTETKDSSILVGGSFTDAGYSNKFFILKNANYIN